MRGLDRDDIIPRMNIPGRRAFVYIKSHVEACLLESGIKEGLLLANTIQMKFIKFHSA